MDELSILSEDIFVVCTDGLTSVMKDEEILGTVMKQEIGPETVQRLIERVNVRGGPDNVTVALIMVHGGNAAQTG